MLSVILMSHHQVPTPPPHKKKALLNFALLVRFHGISIAWYKARIPGFPRKPIREGASSLFRQGAESPQNVSYSWATPRLHMQVWVALDQETFVCLSSPRPKRLLAPSLSIFGEIQNSGLVQQSDPNLVLRERKGSPKSKFWGRMSGGRPHGYLGGRPGAKTSVSPRSPGKKQAFRYGRP